MRKTGGRKGEKKGQHKKMSGEKEMGKDLKKEKSVCRSATVVKSF